MKKLLILLPAITLFAACQQPVPAGQMTDKNAQVSVKVTDEKGNKSDAPHSAIKSDQDFLEMMIPHHQEAVDSSKLLLAKAEDSEMKKFLEGVVDTQSKEIEQMKVWYKEWFGKDYVANGNYMAMMNGAAINQTYRTGMIVHHMEAIAMAKQLKTFTKRPELLKLADDIIATQTKEVEFLRSENSGV